MKTPFGYYVFTVDSTTPGTTQTLQQATATIRATIASQQESAANALLQADFTKKWAKLTKCSSGFIVSPSCGNAPTATGATGATGAP